MRSIQLSYGRAVEREANKPSSVSVAGGGSFLWDVDCSTPRAAYPGLSTEVIGAGQRLVLYLALLRVGFTVPRAVASRAVVSYTTVSPLPVVLAHPSAVCSLLHFPSSCDARLLAGTLPCELGLSSTGAKPAAIRTRFPSVKQHCQCARQDSNLKPPDP
jgi:hypothetical protein